MVLREADFYGIEPNWETNHARVKVLRDMPVPSAEVVQQGDKVVPVAVDEILVSVYHGCAKCGAEHAGEEVVAGTILCQCGGRGGEYTATNIQLHHTACGLIVLHE
jgi:hypothetical protein